MKEIELTQGYTAIVDDEDYERVSQYNWHWGGGRVTTTFNNRTIGLIRFILGITDTKQEVGYINGDSFDCRKSNLKLMNRTDINRKAAKKRPGGKASSKFKGVSWSKSRNKWHVNITVNYKSRFVGRFDYEIEAALAYDSAARTLFGEVAYLNFPDKPKVCLIHLVIPRKIGARKRKKCASRYLGAYYYPPTKRYALRFTHRGEKFSGYFSTEESAAYAYDKLAIEHRGVDAVVNFADHWRRKRQKFE